MNTKTPILSYFETHWNKYHFVAEKRPNLVFRKDSQDGIFDMLSLQRDTKSNALSLNIGCTYNHLWEGETAEPLGRDSGLANLRLRSRCIEAIQHWHFYKSTPEGLTYTLNEIRSQFNQFSPAFFEQSRKDLLSNSLLQLALKESKEFSLDELSGLEEMLQAARYQVGDLTHPVFLKLQKILKNAWTSGTSEDDRGSTNRMAFDCLLLKKSQLSG